MRISKSCLVINFGTSRVIGLRHGLRRLSRQSPKPRKGIASDQPSLETEQKSKKNNNERMNSLFNPFSSTNASPLPFLSIPDTVIARRMDGCLVLDTLSGMRMVHIDHRHRNFHQSSRVWPSGALQVALRLVGLVEAQKQGSLSSNSTSKNRHPSSARDGSTVSSDALRRMAAPARPRPHGIVTAYIANREDEKTVGRSNRSIARGSVLLCVG